MLMVRDWKRAPARSVLGSINTIAGARFFRNTWVDVAVLLGSRTAAEPKEPNSHVCMLNAVASMNRNVIDPSCAGKRLRAMVQA